MNAQAGATARPIGYIGLGRMGGALAQRLRLAHDLAVYDPDPAAVQRLAEQGAQPCHSPAEVAARCDVILLCVPTSDVVRAVLFGEGGLVAAARPGTLIVDQTSGEPAATRAMATDVAARGLQLVDAPVSGGPAGAAAGTIAIMLGAGPAEQERVLPLLRSISPNVFHTGDVGSAHVMKLANNLVSAGHRLVTMEAISLAVRNGVPAATAVAVMLAGSGRNFYLEHHLKPCLEGGRLASAYTLGMLKKDVAQACRLGEDSGFAMRFGPMARQVTEADVNELGRATEQLADALAASAGPQRG